MKIETANLIILLGCLLLICSNAAAQPDYTTYQVTFQIHIANGKTQETLPASLSKIDEKHPALIASVNRDWMKIESNGYPTFVQISHLTDSTSVKYYPDTISAANAVKTAYEVPLSTPVLHSDLKGDEVIVFSTADMHVELLTDTQTVAGRVCRLARFYMTDSVGLDVWYVPDLPMLFWGEYDYLRQVPGLPLKMETYVKDFAFRIGIAATKIVEIKADPSLFEIPKDYTLTKEIKIEAAPY